MLLEHILGFAILEAIVTALIFAYIQKTDSALLYGERSKMRMRKSSTA